VRLKNEYPLVGYFSLRPNWDDFGSFFEKLDGKINIPNIVP